MSSEDHANQKINEFVDFFYNHIRKDTVDPEMIKTEKENALTWYSSNFIEGAKVFSIPDEGLLQLELDKENSTEFRLK